MNKLHINSIPEKWFVTHIKNKILENKDIKKTSQQEKFLEEILENEFPEFNNFVKHLQYKDGMNFWHFYFQKTQWQPHEDFYGNKIFKHFIDKTRNSQPEIFNQLDKFSNNIWHHFLNNPNFTTEKKLLVVEQWNCMAENTLLFQKNLQGKSVLEILMGANDIHKKELVAKMLYLLEQACPFKIEDETSFLLFMKNHQLDIALNKATKNIDSRLKNYLNILNEKNTLNNLTDLDLKEHTKFKL